ncbi:MAG: hypothetical protein DWH82_08600 [Planctomycetota bacterium]|nr:MAG: hypothetical protein DWH82_08600 [Planctomycetota bacterium]
MKTNLQPGPRVLDDRYLEIRARILELAAELDRIDRGSGVSSDPRMDRIHAGIRLLLDGPTAGRAEQVQLLFSDFYDPGWNIPQPRA